MISKTKEITGIRLSHVTLAYELYFDQTRTLKEAIINLLHRRRYVEKRKGKLLALNDISLEVSHGERLGIIGHNGAGKSTLLKVISGILKPTRGDVLVERSVQPLIEVAAGFNLEFSGRENIYLNGYMLGFSRKQIREKEKEIIEFAELAEFIDVPMKYYSSGMQVRLAFTIATSIDPEYLIFDEMLSAGDASFIEKARHRMDSLISKAKILVVVSHDLHTITSFCTRVIVLQKGSIVFDGAPDAAVEHYLDHIERTTSDEVGTPIKMSPLHLEAQNTTSATFSSRLDTIANVTGTASLELLSSTGKGVATFDRAFQFEANRQESIAFTLKFKTELNGEFIARLRINYQDARGTSYTASSDCPIALGKTSAESVNIEWREDRLMASDLSIL